jgi:transcriptional regulator with XRE-family HTH domain
MNNLAQYYSYLINRLMMSNNKEAVFKEAAKQLKEARIREDFSQLEMAKELGYKSARHYHNFEKGKFPKRNKALFKKIDEILGTSLYSMIYPEKFSGVNDSMTSQHADPVKRAAFDPMSLLEKEGPLTPKDIFNSFDFQTHLYITQSEANRVQSDVNSSHQKYFERLVEKYGPPADKIS